MDIKNIKALCPNCKKDNSYYLCTLHEKNIIIRACNNCDIQFSIKYKEIIKIEKVYIDTEINGKEINMNNK